MAGLSYVTLYPVDTSFKDRGVRSIPKEISTASSLHKLRWSMYYSTHPVKPKKGATDVSVTPTEAHKRGFAVIFKLPNVLVYFWTKGYRLSVEESRFHEIIASGKTRLEIDVHDVSLFGTTRNRVKMTPSPDIIQLFGFISAHVHAKTYIHEDIPGKVRTDFPLDPVYVKIISLLQKKKEVGETQIVCVPKTDYVSSLDGVSVYDCAVVPQLRNDCKTADRLAKRRKVETDCNTEIEPIDTTACAFSILTEMYEEFASVCNTGTLLTQREMNMRFPYITKFWRLFQGKGVAAPDRYSQWLWNAEDTFDGSLPFTLSERVLAAVIPLQVTLRPENTERRGHALQIRAVLDMCTQDYRSTIDVVYPMQFGNIHGPLPYAQHIDNDQFRLCFGGHVGTVETLHTARKFAKYKKSNSVLFVYFNRTPAHEAKASLEWATTEYGTVFVQGSSLEPGPAAMHSSANVFHRSLRPPVPWPSTLSSDILTHIRPVERSVGQRPRTNTQRPKLDVFTIGGKSHIQYRAVSYETAVLGQLVLVKGALYSTAIGGKDRFSGYAPLRLKSLRDSRLTSGTQANSRTPPDRLVGRLDPITTALPEDEGVSIGAWSSIDIPLLHGSVRMLHEADPCSYVGPTLAGVRLRVCGGMQSTDVARSLHAALSMAMYVEAGKEDIDRLLEYFDEGVDANE